MRYLLILSLTLLIGCASSKTKTHTAPPDLKYAKQGVVDAKGFLSKAQSTNQEIDDAIRRLLESAE